MRRLRIGTLILTLLIPLLVGGISAKLSASGMRGYGDMIKPAFSPPSWVFPIAWTVLYIMMGLASYFVAIADTDKLTKLMALEIYALQLAMNFMWSIIFFNMEEYLFAFVWLFAMWGVVIWCMFRFYTIDRAAAFLLVPYILWLTFAAYLNFGVYLLSRPMA